MEVLISNIVIIIVGLSTVGLTYKFNVKEKRFKNKVEVYSNFLISCQKSINREGENNFNELSYAIAPIFLIANKEVIINVKKYIESIKNGECSIVQVNIFNDIVKSMRKDIGNKNSNSDDVDFPLYRYYGEKNNK